MTRIASPRRPANRDVRAFSWLGLTPLVRIVHLNPFYFPYAGGIERRIRSVSRRMRRMGHDVHLVTAQQPGGPGGIEEDDGLTVHRLPSRFLVRRFYNPPPVITPRLLPYLQSLRPDVVDYHFRWSPSYNVTFQRLANCGKVVTYHNTYGEGHGLLGAASRINDWFYMHTLRTAHRIVCVSDAVRRDLLARKETEDRLVVNRNAVEKHELAHEGPPETDVGPLYAVAVGRFVSLKAFDVLIDAWPMVREDMRLVLVGKGPMLDAWRRRAARRNVSHRVTFTGWVSDEEKARLLRHAYAYLHPARFESFPFSMLEAFEAGVPVVSSRVGGLPEAVADAGPLLGHDPREWAKAVADLDNPDEHARRAAKAKERSAIYDWDDITNDLVAAYDEARRVAG